MTFEFSRQILKKFANVKFQEIASSGYEMFLADRRTARHIEANSRFS